MRRVGSYLLNFVYMGVLALVSPLFLWNSLTKGKYREGFREKFWGEVPERAGNRDCIWLHAVSVGEVNLLATTLRELTSRRPDIEIVISTTTKTGYELARRKYGEQHSVFYCPLDFSWATRRAMQRVRPSLLVLAELELWPNLIIAAKEQGARVAIINGRLSDNSFRGYRRAKWLVGRVLGMVDLVAAQDATTAGRFRKLRTSKPDAGDQAVIVTGSLKYDGAETHRSNARTRSLQTLAGIAKDDIVWLVGSTQSPEEEMAVRLYAELRQRHPPLRLVIVPRHPERFDEVARQLDGSGLPWHRRSQLEASLPVPQSIILVDTVGELGAWWGTASIGFVGGSFGDRGGQNMIEPAAYGVATCFGPNTWNFRDIVAALLHADAAEVVHDEAALEEFVARCLDEPEFSRSLGERARQFVASQLGATKRTVDLLERLLPEVRANSNAAA